jgi:tetratricopeptide (TPR) repeat protein
MPTHRRLAQIVLVLWWGLLLSLGGCTTIGGEEKRWDFSRPYQSVPPARSPHALSNGSASGKASGGIFIPKLVDFLSPSSGESAPSKNAPKEGNQSPPSGVVWTERPAAFTDPGGQTPLLAGNPPPPPLLLRQAEEAFANGRNQLAYQYLEQAVLANPGDPVLWQKAALVALRANEPEMAARLAWQAVQRFADSPVLWQLVALARYRMGDFPGAAEAARQAISLDNRYALSYFLVGAALQRQGQAGEAVPYFEQAARLDPRFAPPGL